MWKPIKNAAAAAFYRWSGLAVRKAIAQDAVLRDVWELSQAILPDLGSHYATAALPEEAKLRVRMLISAQVQFLKAVVDDLPVEDGARTYLDVGDTDGSVRLLFEARYPTMDLETLGINLQRQAVENIRAQGLAAECVDAMDLARLGRTYDIVSVFETLEHLPNPIGFLQAIRPTVRQRLILSVPLVPTSRVSLRYLSAKWPAAQTPTIANNHIFELCPQDLEKICRHAGWEIQRRWRVRTFPVRGPLRWVLQPAWRAISFEGWYFISLVKDDRFSSRYVIE